MRPTAASAATCRSWPRPGITSTMPTRTARCGCRCSATARRSPPTPTGLTCSTGGLSSTARLPPAATRVATPCCIGGPTTVRSVPATSITRAPPTAPTAVSASSRRSAAGTRWSITCCNTARRWSRARRTASSRCVPRPTAVPPVRATRCTTTTRRSTATPWSRACSSSSPPPPRPTAPVRTSARSSCSRSSPSGIPTTSVSRSRT